VESPLNISDEIDPIGLEEKPKDCKLDNHAKAPLSI
jgi:hypothetical protein